MTDHQKVIEATIGEAPTLYNDLAIKTQKESAASALIQIIMNGSDGTGISILSDTYSQRLTLQDILKFAHEKLKARNEDDLKAAQEAAASDVEYFVGIYGEEARLRIKDALEFTHLNGVDQVGFDKEVYINQVMAKLKQTKEEVPAPE